MYMGFWHRNGKFYTRVIMKHIGIFIFIGLLSVAFGRCGWFPDEDNYAFSDFSCKTTAFVCAGGLGSSAMGAAVMRAGGCREVHQVESLLQAQEPELVTEKLQKGNG